jgi:DNA-binding GntR family transcriptional regulator
MTSGGSEGSHSRAGTRDSSASVLADRIAAALVHHEPGWRLPRLTALSRRYNVSVAEVGAAVDELAARHLLRRLPDGQVYRASPAEYLLPLEGVGGLSSSVDPMGGMLTCRSRQASCRRVPEDTGRALQLTPGESVLVIRSLWLLGGEPGALSATYLPARLGGLARRFAGSPLPVPGLADAAQAGTPRVGGARREDTGDGWPDEAWNDLGWGGTDRCVDAALNGGQADSETAGRETAATPGSTGLPQAIQLELSLPSPSVARSLRLSAGQPVTTVTVRFDDPVAGTPVALSMAMLRPDMFRIVVQSPGAE